MTDKREKLKYTIAKNLYQKAKENISNEHKDVLLHPIAWIEDKHNMNTCWKQYLLSCDYRQDDPFSIYMNFMCKNFT